MGLGLLIHQCVGLVVTKAVSNTTVTYRWGTFEHGPCNGLVLSWFGLQIMGYPGFPDFMMIRKKGFSVLRISGSTLNFSLIYGISQLTIVDVHRVLEVEYANDLL